MAKITGKNLESNLVFTTNPQYASDPLVDNDLARKKYIDDADALLIPLTQKAAASGVATLDANSKIPSSQLPAIAITNVFVVADIAARDLLTIGAADGEVQEGDVVKVTDASADPIIAVGPASYIYSGSAYILLSVDDKVLSVNGETGVVVLNSDHITEAANLYFTDARAKAAAVDDTAYAASWDAVTDIAPSKNAVYDKMVLIETAIANVTGAAPAEETPILEAGDITNGYIDLAHEAQGGIVQITPVGGILQTPSVDYTTTVEVGVTRITFAADLLELIAGDQLVITYEWK